MAEYVMKIPEEDRLEKITARTDAVFGKIMAKFDILLQLYNCPINSSHGATDSSKEIPTLETTTTDGIISSMEPVVKHSAGEGCVGSTNHFVTEDVALPASDAFLPSLEPIEEPIVVCETEMVAPTSTRVCSDDIMDLSTVTIPNPIESFACGNISIDGFECPFSTKSIKAHSTSDVQQREQFPELVEHLDTYIINQDLHCGNSQIKFDAQSGLLNFAHHVFAEMCDQGVLSWTDLIQGSVARVNGWNGKQVQSDLTSILSFTGWYETPLPKPPDWTYDAIAKPPLPPEPPEMSSKVVVSTLSMIAKVLKFGAYNIKFGENSVWIADMLAILHVIEESNSLIDGSCLMESIESLLEKHEIIGGLVLDLVLLIGYNFHCVIGGKYFVLAATHGSVIQGHRLFVKLPNIDVVIWSNWIKSCDSFCAANFTSCLVLVMVLVGLMIKVQCYSPKVNVNIYTKVVLQTGCIIIDVSRVHKLGAKKFGAFSITQQTSDPKMSCFLHLDFNFACTDTSQSPTKFSIYVKTHASQLLPQGKVHVFQFKLIVPAVSDTISAQKVFLVACIWYILLDRVTLLLGMNTLEIIKSLIGGCKPIICPQQVFLCACLLPCVLILVSLSTTQQMSGSKKVIPEAFTHLALIVGDITRLEYLVSHTYLVTCLSSMRLDDGSCWTLHEKLILTGGNEDSFYPLKNVDDDRRLLYIGSGAETLALKKLEEFKKKIFWVQVALVELEFVLIYKSFINISFLQKSAEQVVASKKVRMPIWNSFHITATQDLQIDKSGVYYFCHIARSLHFKQWDPGKFYNFNWQGKLDFWSILEDVLDFLKTGLNHNLEDKVGFKGDGNVMILIEKTVSSNEDNKFVITVRTRRHGLKKNCTLRREHCIYKAMKA